jgi:hypothetical protein
MNTNPDFAIHEPGPQTRALDPSLRELDRRFNDGINVTLLWNERTDQVSVAVHDEKTGESFELAVDAEDALTAFQHPYAYSSRGLTAPALAA